MLPSLDVICDFQIQALAKLLIVTYRQVATDIARRDSSRCRCCMDVDVRITTLYCSSDISNAGPTAAISGVGSCDSPSRQKAPFSREGSAEEGNTNRPVDAGGRTVNVCRKDIVRVISDPERKLQPAVFDLYIDITPHGGRYRGNLLAAIQGGPG